MDICASENQCQHDLEKARWGLNELLEAINKAPLATDIPVMGISIDTRTLKPGDLYIAIVGDAHDGHSFVESALQKGAAAAIVHQDGVTEKPGLIVVVDDTLIALQQIAAYVRGQSQAITIAVTGSVGKTTTKSMLAHVLSHFGTTVCSKGSFNNHWGVPLSLLDLRPDTQYGVFEIGMNHPGEIEPLAVLAAPDIAIITAIGEAHIGYMETIEAIADEKATIFNGLSPDHNIYHRNGIAIINADTPCVDRLIDAAKPHDVLLCGASEAANIQKILQTELDSVHAGMTEVTARIGNDVLQYRLPLIGDHFVQDSLLVLAVCHALGLGLYRACNAFESFTLPVGRGAKHRVRLPNNVMITLIDDAYNANPTSMRAGLMVLQKNDQADKPRHIAVLGEMLELGDQLANLHRALAGVIEDAGVDHVFCCGEGMTHLYDALPVSKRALHAKTANELIDPLMGFLQDGDVLYIKGSNSSAVHKIAQFILAQNIIA